MRKAFLFLLILGIGVAQSGVAAVHSHDEISQAIDKLSDSTKRIKIENQRQQANHERLLSDYEQIMAESEREQTESEREQADYERLVFDNERLMAESERELERQRQNNPNARIGMTPIQVAYESNWGLPDSTNTQGKFELWIYTDGRYLYFINDKLTSIHD